MWSGYGIAQSSAHVLPKRFELACCLGFSETGQTAIEWSRLRLEDLNPCCRRERPVHGFPQVSEKREFLSRLPFFLLFPSSF